MIFPKLHISWERWKWNDEYGIWVSTHGRFKSDKKKDLKVKTTGRDYLAVKSYKQDKYVLAHRLVMITWKPIANYAEMTVDHLDHNKRNNCLSNLEWVTLEENRRRAVEDQAKLEKKVKITVSHHTLNHFYLCCNGLYFNCVQDAFGYIKTQNASAQLRDVEKTFQTLLNAYNNNDPHYVENGFVKTAHKCEISIIKKKGM